MDREQTLVKLRERIVAFAASRIARDIAEDLAQETLVLLEEKYPHITELHELLPLSFQIVRFKMMSLRKKTQRRGEYSQVSVDEISLPDLGASPATALERRQMMERLTAAIGKLEPRCRNLIRWKLEGRTFAEIRTLTGARSINTVYTWDFRCRQKLLELLGGSWEERP